MAEPLWVGNQTVKPLDRKTATKLILKNWSCDVCNNRLIKDAFCAWSKVRPKENVCIRIAKIDESGSRSFSFVRSLPLIFCGDVAEVDISKL